MKTGRRDLRVAGGMALAALSVLVLAPAAQAQGTTVPGWQTTFSTDFRYFSHETRRATVGVPSGVIERGTQAVQSIGAQLSGYFSPELKFQFMVKGGAMYARTSSPAGSGAYSGFQDTVVSSTLTYLGLPGFQPFLSLNLNLPTGQSNSVGNDANAKADVELVPRPAFGEGFNIGPTIGVNIPFTSALVGTLSVGHTLRGSFRREPDLVPPFLAPIRVNPGDVTTLTASLGWRGEQLSLKGSVAYSLESETQYNSAPFYKAGGRLVLQLAAGYGFNENWSARLQGSYSHFGKNKVLRFGLLPPLVTEQFNSNNDVYRLSADLTYRRDNWNLGPVATFTYRARNGWDPTSFNFVTTRSTLAIGLASGFAPRDNVKLSFRAERIVALTPSTPDKVVFGFPIAGTAVAASRTNAWQLSGSASLQF